MSPKPFFLVLSTNAAFSASFLWNSILELHCYLLNALVLWVNVQAAAVLGIALVSLGDDIGSEMALRTFDHLLHYGELPIRR